MPTVHVLGNGPSIQHFESDLFHTEPTDGIRVGCNLTYPHLNPVWTVLGRDLLFYICENKIDFTIPVVTFTIDIRKVGQNTRNPEHLNSLNTTVFYNITTLGHQLYKDLVGIVLVCWLFNNITQS